jgi:hypothetical protein
VYRDASGTIDRDSGIRAVEQKAAAVFDRASVFIATQVGAVLEELVEKISLGRLDLNAIETGHKGVLCGTLENLHDASDF